MSIAAYDYTVVTLTCSGKEVHCIMEEGIEEGTSGRMRLVSDTEGELPFREGDTIRLTLTTKETSYEGGEVVVDKLEMGNGRDWSRLTIQFHREW